MSSIIRCRKGVMAAPWAEGNRDGTSTVSILTGAPRIAQDRIIVTTGLSGCQGLRSMRRKAQWGRTRQSRQWSAQAMRQRLSSGFALAGYQLPRSGLVQLGFNLTDAGSRLTP